MNRIVRFSAGAGSLSLAAAGLRAGDRVAVLSTPRPEYLVTLLAAFRLGAVWVGLNPKYTYRELAHVVADSRPRLILSIARAEGREPTGLLYKVNRPTLDQRMAELVAEVDGHRDYDLRKIIDLKMDKIRKRLRATYKIELVLTDAVGDAMSARCKQITIGARLINLIINETVLPEIAKKVLELMGSDKN